MTLTAITMFSLLFVFTLSSSYTANASTHHVRTHKVKKHHKAKKYVSKRKVNWARKAEQGLSARNKAARRWVSKHESGNRYFVSNGSCYGKFQLLKSSLNGDYSKRNQELTANRYVKARYGSWCAAKAHWLSHHWY